MYKEHVIAWERKSLEKMKKLQLPSAFKKIGFGIFFVFFVSMFVNAFLIHHDELKMLSKYGLLIGLLITSISKERIEDELAKKIGVSRQTINSIETIRYQPSTMLALKLSVVFNKPVNDFFELDEDEKK